MLFVLLHVSPHGLPLLLQMGRNHIVYICEQQLEIGLQTLLGLLKRLHHHLAGLLSPAPLVIFAPPDTGHHVMSESGDGMVLLIPVVHLVHRAVG